MTTHSNWPEGDGKMDYHMDDAFGYVGDLKTHPQTCGVV